MIRVHLAQIHYNPAYYDSPVDYLEEPSFLTEGEAPLGSLRLLDEMQSLLVDMKSSYVEHIKEKTNLTAEWSARRGAHILAFPEYAIPVQVLPALQSRAKSSSMIIVAGTHRVVSGDEAASVYRSLGVSVEGRQGAACAPVLFPDGKVELVWKTNRSKWEPNLNTRVEDPRVFRGNCGGVTFTLAVVPCIDSLHADLIGKLWSNRNDSPEILICPSLSPSIKPFLATGTLAAMKECLFAFANCASYGETFFNIPEDWQGYLQGPSLGINGLPPNTEAIFEVDFEPGRFFMKRGSAIASPPCTHPMFYPFIYERDSAWLSEYVKLTEDIIEWLQNKAQGEAVDWLDSYLSDNAALLPDLLHQKLKYLRHSLLPLYDGKIESVETVLKAVTVPDSVEDTRRFWANRVANAMEIFLHYFQSTGGDTVQLIKCLTSLKNQQQRLPKPSSGKEETKERLTTPRENLAFVGEQNLIETFQNRGGDLDLARELLMNAQHRVIVITGAVGIGKSDFVNWMFRKQFGDWEPIKIHIPVGSKVSRLVADIGYQLGISLDIDSLAAASGVVFRQKIRKILARFYSRTKRALILDDLHHILKDGNARDHRQLGIFVEEASDPPNYFGGRIILVTSQWLPDSWIFRPGVAHVRLKGIQDLYVRRVIEFHMRQAGLVKDERIPEAPQTLLDIIKGHPLSARLAVEALREKDPKGLTDELMLSDIAGQLARELLKRVEMTPEQNITLQKLSVFRLPIRLDIAATLEEFAPRRNELMDLARRCVLSFDGHSLEMHEAVRRFYLSEVDLQDLSRFHRLAALYYDKIYNSQRFHTIGEPGIIAELVHHLTLCGEISQAKDLRLRLVEELKPSARQIYREYKQYPQALSVYRLLADVVPDDPQVQAYLGRCYARLYQWNDSDQAFRKAIEVAQRTGEPAWWIYRDWGHIRARFGYYSEAMQHLQKASSSKPHDVSIKSSLAYIYWRQGNYPEARQLFEDALEQNPYHEYTLTYYAKFLKSIHGDLDYANTLTDRLHEIETGRRYVEPKEYDIEFDYDE